MAFVLTPMERLAMMAGGAGVVVLSIIIVACVVGPGCYLNALLLGDPEKKRREGEQHLPVYATTTPKLRLTTYSKSPDSSPQELPQLQSSSPGATPTSQRYSFISPLHHTVTETHSLLGSLASKRDSTYSSMSEYSGRSSPTNSCKSSVGDSGGSGVGSAVGSPVGGGDAQGQATFSLQYVQTNHERGTGKLVVTVCELRGLAGREYLGGACDPYVKVILWRERRSLRKVKSAPLHVFRTRTIRHTTNPAFNQSFVVEVSRNELKELMVKLVALDCDKWTSPTTLGEVTQPLREIKTLTTADEKTTLNYYLVEPKLDLGEVLFGLSYLPTAQRLSVSVIKATNLKFCSIVPDLEEFCPYIRVLLISGSGRVLKKKKTTWRAATVNPIWNETLIFDLPHTQVEHVTFILAVCSRPLPPTFEVDVLDSGDALPDVDKDVHDPCGPRDSGSSGGSGKRSDKYVGKVVLGFTVRGGDQKQHWASVLAAPRKVVSQWHTLK
ncbi:synaptotagmin-5-like isoform X2 [Oratosquilla oratoria]|uniref:synaptotagmin-5-like isoform X2 n=1 Tax=Oratosquilla oratoria TaxID=337810 RepID=UPI003F76CC82